MLADGGVHDPVARLWAQAERIRAYLAQRHSDEDVAEIRAIGDNTGCMALKGASPQYTGEPVADRWPLDGGLQELAARWAIEPERDLAQAGQPA